MFVRETKYKTTFVLYVTKLGNSYLVRKPISNDVRRK